MEHFSVLGFTFLNPRWRPPRYIRERSKEQHRKLQDKYHIIVDGEDIPPPIASFADMKIPNVMLKYLKSKRIIDPTPIQLQGMPVASVLSFHLWIGLYLS
jgi:ATP-dependent RNA helicase DDX41